MCWSAMGVITYFIPFLYLFAAMFKLQNEPAGPDVIRVPGGKPVARVVAIVGFVTTAFTIGLSLIPQPDEPNKPLAVIKIVGLSRLAGADRGVDLLGRQEAGTTMNHVGPGL